MRIDLIDPLIKSVAKKFKVSEAEREDLIQEGYLTVLKSLKSKPEKTYDDETEIELLWGFVYNAMVSFLRKRAVRISRERCVEGFEIQYQDEKFEKIAEREAIRELSRFLNDIEKRVLLEIFEPSAEFTFFLKKIRTIQKINKIREDFNNKDHLAEFLGISIGQLKHIFIALRQKGGDCYARFESESGARMLRCDV